MRIAKSMAVAAVLTLIGSGTWAAEQVQGKITKMDKATHQITLQLGTPGQTVGSASAATQVFTLNHDLSYDNLNVGEQITVKVEELNGVRQITKWEKK